MPGNSFLFADRSETFETTILRDAFDLPPEKAIRFLESKGIRVDFDWTTATAEAKAKAFAISGEYRIGILSALKAKLEKAAADGMTLQSFVKELDRDRIPQPARVATVFRANIQSAYMAGRWKEQEATKDANPYLEYVSVMDASTTVICKDLNGKAYPIDHPVWDRFYPPNHFGCRARVEARSERDLKRRGIKPSTEIPDDVDQPVNGFDYNPGKSALWDKKGMLPECADLKNQFSEDNQSCRNELPTMKWSDIGRPSFRELKKEQFQEQPEILEIADDVELALKVLEKVFGVDDQNPVRVLKSPIEHVAITHEKMKHLVEKRKDSRERYANFVIPTIEHPFEIWAKDFDGEIRRQYLGLFKGEHSFLCSVQINRDGGLLYNVMQVETDNINKKRQGVLFIYGEDIK
ncbi:MAG: minor capsid protein [Bacteroidetes bacterium]|nr:minor capsid protein [Bacteroidota bacterium]